MKQAMVKHPPLPRQYGEELLVMERGEGCHLFDCVGNRYLDMGSGIAVNALGYGREDLAEIAAKQMKRLVHASNLFATEPQLELAQKMVNSPAPGHAGFEAVHFGNSGAEANETAMKYARLYAWRKNKPHKIRLLAFEGAFHGRTLGALSLTANPAYKKPFGPLVPGVEILPFGDVEALTTAMDQDVAGVIVEPIQGEGGLNMVSRDFARALNALCQEHDALLIADEVQTGMGRCGSLFASGLVGLEPDLICLAKPLAGGLPLSAVLIPPKVNALLAPGDHATTFGGGPVTTAVASAVWDIISVPSFLAEVRRKGDILESLLAQELEQRGLEGEIRGAGLLRGIRLKGTPFDGPWCSKIVQEARNNGLIILKTGADVLRLAPPLVMDEASLKEGVALLFQTIDQNAKTTA
ncbi:MAG: acetylornithine transaminase [Spirochaetales bacterium]|nr:acetylornithine transaminase [Spirochaetales bacterium]